MDKARDPRTKLTKNLTGNPSVDPCLRQKYVRTSREVQRIEGILRSPVNTCYTETITGRTTIDAYKIQVKSIGGKDLSRIYKYLGLHD